MWSERAAAAEASVCRRSLQRYWAWPVGSLARSAHPPTWLHYAHEPMNYWWQAHVYDCLIDAELRNPRARRRSVIARWPRTMWVHNKLRWTNSYYDDVAWFGIALERARRLLGEPTDKALEIIVEHFTDAWHDDELGGFPWRLRDDFRNAPANGPAAILLARACRFDSAHRCVDWITERLVADTGLIVDGVATGVVHSEIYTYNQGTVLGAELELVRSQGRDPGRLCSLVEAMSVHLAVDGVLPGGRGGDHGLFAGICARYLALVATTLPIVDEATAQAAHTARDMVLISAQAAWLNRVENSDGVWFGPEWAVPATVPTAADSLGANQSPAGVSSSAVPERDLSVQVGGWMLMEAAATLG